MNDLVKSVIKNVAAKKKGSQPDIKAEARRAAIHKIQSALDNSNAESLYEALNELKTME